MKNYADYNQKTRSRIYADLFIAKKIYTYFKEFGYVNDSCLNICLDIEALFSSNIEEIYDIEIFNNVFNKNKDIIEDPLCFQIHNINTIYVYYLDIDNLKCYTKTIKVSDYYEYKKQISLYLENLQIEK